MHLRRIWVLLLLGICSYPALRAQEVLISDVGVRAPQPSGPQRKAATPSGLRIMTLSLPFFDDFSGESLSPDTTRWAIHPVDNRRPGISIAKGHNVPSKGVATFDGATFGGRKYDAALAVGESDTLASQPIDLSGHVPADSVMLSFFVQLGGAGESPESSDSLVLLFDTTGNYDYAQVWSLLGAGAAQNTFQLFYIALDSANYFHSAFRFKFVRYGSLNGELDQFHLDYVHLDAQRSKLDSVFGDVSAARFAQSPMAPYTAMPHKQFVRTNAVTTTRALVSNAGNPASGGNWSLAIDDPVGGNSFSGTTIVSASVASMPGFGHDTINGPAFSSQATNMAQYGSMRLTATRTGAADQHPENDTLRTIFGVDSVLALDDGVSDFAYGLTNARAFCQQFEIDQPDTLVAVWMHFAPTMHYNQATNVSTDLDGKGFRLVIWDSLDVDSALIETSGGMNVNYGSALNEYIRYQLISEVVVPTTFWVGMRQSDGMAIGLGFDRNDSGKRIYVENANSTFELSNNRGTLMIRPEFRIPHNTVGIGDTRPQGTLVVTVAPNPVQGEQIDLQLAEPDDLRSVSFTLMDLQGRTLQAWHDQLPQKALSLDIAMQPADGIYLLRVSGVDHRGNPRHDTLKLIFRHN